MITYILWFMIYSFAGWLWELVYCRAVHGKWHLSGFLTLPLLPIYGFSALGIVLLVQPYVHNPVSVFLLAATIVTIIEYSTSFALEKVFHIKLWDYSNWPANVQGRIGLFSSLGFGFMGLVVVYVLHPWMANIVDTLPSMLATVVAYILLGLFVIDYINSTISLVRLRTTSNKLVSGSLDDLQQYIESQISELRERRQKTRLAIDRWYHYNIRRIRRAYPSAKTVDNERKK